MVRCDRCEHTAVIYQRYSGAHLCGEHFSRSVLRRVGRSLRHQWRLARSGTLAVALSGGKDSTVALHLTQRLWGSWPQLRIIALTIDEGIANYRADGIAVAARTCAQLGVEHRLVPLRPLLGADIDVIATLPDRQGSPCSACGVGRRSALNEAALKAGAQALVTGHNLDDVAQGVLMNLLKGEVTRLGRMAPHTHALPGMVPRLLPLREIPEQEVLLYAHLHGLPYHQGTCPHAGGAQRNLIREVLLQLEDAHPGTRHGLLRTHAQVLTLLLPVEGGIGADLHPCQGCAAPTTQLLCEPCQVRARVSETLPGTLGSP